MDHEAVQATALRVVFDLLHAFGLETFNIGEGASNSDTVQEAVSTGTELYVPIHDPIGTV